MKKPPPPSALSPARFWRPLALSSLAANAVLALLMLRPPAATPLPGSATVSAAPAPSAAARPRELAPYAALGSFMAENNRVPDLGWTEAQFAAFLDGFRASYEGRGLPFDDDAKRLSADISRRVQAMLAKERPDPMEEYFRTLREKEGVLRTASGLHYRVTEPGAGPNARATDTVVMSFAARLPDGQALAPLSRARVRSAVRDLLPGLAEGVQLLNVGGKALIYVPPSLGFADSDWPAQLPKGTPLVFFIELHEIVGQ